jgi:hypothetical protein
MRTSMTAASVGVCALLSLGLAGAAHELTGRFGVVENFVRGSDSHHAGADYRAPQADGGALADVMSVKSAVPVLLAAGLSVGRIARPLGEPLASGVDAVWADDVEGDVLHETRVGLELAAGDEGYAGYRDNEFVVREWQGVTVNGNAAAALVLGHQSYLVRGQWVADPDGQYQVNLVRGSDNSTGWELLTYADVRLGGSG